MAGFIDRFLSRRQEREEAEALRIVSFSIQQRAVVGMTRGLPFAMKGRTTLESPELAAVSNGLGSKSPENRDRALSLCVQIENLASLEHLLVEAFFASEVEQTKLNCIHSVVPRIEPSKAHSILACVARDGSQPGRVRGAAAQELARSPDTHPDGWTHVEGLLQETRAPEVASSILTEIFKRSLEPKRIEIVKSLCHHYEIQIVAEAFEFLAQYRHTKPASHEASHLSRFLSSPGGDLLRAQIHAGLASDDVHKQIAACSLLVKDPRCASHTLNRLVGAHHGLFSSTAAFVSPLFIRPSGDIADALFPQEHGHFQGSSRSRRVTVPMSSRALWLHALGYSAVHHPSDARVLNVFKAHGSRDSQRHTAASIIPGWARRDRDSEILTLWRDLLVAREDPEVLLRSFSREVPEQEIGDLLRIAGEIHDWTGPMEIDCAAALGRCLASGQSNVRLRGVALAAALGQKIKQGSVLLPLLPREGGELDRALSSLVRATFSPNDSLTLNGLREDLMSARGEVVLGGLCAARRLGDRAKQFQGELTVLGMSEHERISALAREVLSGLGIDRGDDGDEGVGFFTLRLAG